MSASRPSFPVAFLIGAAALAGCGPGGSPPSMDPLGNQVAYVGSEFTLRLQATDPDLDELQFTFRNSDLSDIQARATVSPYGPGTAVFRWTPLAGDVGVHAFDFVVSDGSSSDTETISIEVKASVGENGAPIFRQPLGTGTTLDLTQEQCLDLDILVEDLDDLQITIAQEEPVVEGAALTQQGGFSARWHWCPTPEQASAQDRYMLILSAKDDDNPKTIKNFLIVLRKRPKDNCAGSPPVISHTPQDENTLAGLTIAADVSDAEGLKSEPLLYYSTTPVGATPDLGAMTQTVMILIDGDMRSGLWAADVPNPVASGGQGATATVYYVFVAQDNDDTSGDCDHLTQAPTTGAYDMTVTNPGGSGNQALCTLCTADVQCGGDGDNCLRMGTEGLYYCGRACVDNSGCPEDYYCSISEYVSIDGVPARQCIPDDYSCVEAPPPPTCTDDAYEDNDSKSAADAKPALNPGTFSMQACPSGTTSDDEDWYKIVLSSEKQVTVSIAGGSTTDLDLALVNAAGTTLARSEGLDSDETVSACLQPGTYYVRVFSIDVGSNSYTLTYQSGACTGSCDDMPDGDRDHARVVDLEYEAFSLTNQLICVDDEDWYYVYLFTGEELHVTLLFDQASPNEDLDLHLYNATDDLTPCYEWDPSDCSEAYGQSADSNEHLAWQATSPGDYYVVVRGWDGSENIYDICIGLSSTDCPMPP